MSFNKLIVFSDDHREGSAKPPTDFYIDLQHLGVSDVSSLAISSATIPNLFPNVFGANCVLYLYNAGNVVEVRVPEGRYDVNTLPPVLDTALAAAGLSTTTSIKNGVFDWNALLPYTPLSIDTIKERLIAKSKILATDSLNRLLGAPHTPGGATTIVNLLGIQTLFLSVSEVGASHTYTSRDHVSDIIATIDLSTTPYGATRHEVFETVDAALHFKQGKSIKSFHVRLLDHLGQLLSLPQNQLVSFQLKFI